jgi:hypothetical protein
MLRATLHLASQDPEFSDVLDEFGLAPSIAPAA